MALVSVAAAIMVAVAIYRPFDARPFEFLDFPEFFGILERGPTFVDRVHGLVSYYQGQGRANVLAYALIAVRWTVFERDTAAWQMTRFVVMCALIGVAYVLLRRLGGTRTAAAAGASLFLTTEAASHGWLRLSMMEPLATLFVYTAALVATRFQRTERAARDLVTIALLVIAAILTKEVIVAATPLVALTGLCVAANGSLSMPDRSRRNTVLIATLAGAAAFALVPTMLAVIGARGSAYAASYGSNPLQPSRIVSFMFATLVPFDVFGPNPMAPFAFGCYGLIATVGFTIGMRDARDRHAVWIPLAIGGVVALGGAVAYVPWPSFEIFYTIPYLIAPALILSVSITAIERRAAPGRWALYAGTLCVSLYSLSLAHSHARRTAAAQRLVDRTAVVVSGTTAVDTAVFAVAQLHPQAWQGTGPTIARYATAVRHLRFPAVSDAACGEAIQRAATATARTLVVVLSSQCRAPATSTLSVQERYSRWDWKQLTLVSDSIRADLVRGPLEPDATGRTR